MIICWFVDMKRNCIFDHLWANLKSWLTNNRDTVFKPLVDRVGSPSNKHISLLYTTQNKKVGKYIFSVQFRSSFASTNSLDFEKMYIFYMFYSKCLLHLFNFLFWPNSNAKSRSQTEAVAKTPSNLCAPGTSVANWRMMSVCGYRRIRISEQILLLQNKIRFRINTWKPEKEKKRKFNS